MAFMSFHRLQPSPARPSSTAASVAAARSVVPTAVAHSPTQAMANPGILYMRNPILGGWSQGRPLPRTSFALPVLISPDAPPTESTLFEDPQDPSKKHYLPKYAIATVGSGGGQAYSVSFAANSDGFVLTVQLTDVTDASLATNDARIDATTTRYVLTANLQGLAASWDFASASSSSSALTLTLTVTDPASRDSIYRAMTDPSAQAKLVIRRSFAIAVPAPPQAGAPQHLYRESQTAIDSSLAFTFDPVLDKSIFGLLGSVGVGESTWIVTQVPYASDNRSFPYYQDARQPDQIYYLPDTFQVSRQQSAPHAPNITITSTGTDPNSLSFTVSVLAVPIWNPDRIANAASWWQKYLHASTPPAMHLFEASNTGLQLTLPSADGSGAPTLAQQSAAIIDMAGGINCSVTLSLGQLQQIYAALFDEVSQLLSGVVTVTVNSDVESIHFSWRAGDFAGSVLDAASTFDAEQSQFNVVVSNSCESPVHVESLPATIMRGPIDPVSGKPSTKVPDLGEKITPALPVDLAPQASTTTSTASSSSATGPSSLMLSMRMIPENLGDLGGILGQAFGGLTKSTPIPAQSGADDSVVVIDFGHTTVKPDAGAIWDAIMSNQVVGPVQRNVKVMAFGSMFEPPSSASTSSTTASAASAPIKAAQVVFESGQTVDFDSSTQADASGLMSQTVSLAVPIKEYVLGTGDTSIYRYRVDLIRATGTQQGQWVSSNADSFYVQTGGS
jgi:hypothetical protein